MSTTTTRIMKATALLSAGALLLGACSSSPKKPKKKAASTTTTTKAPVCALTGAPSPLGAIPQRTAIGAKIDNYQDARPQSGLDKTDIVFEEPVEGGITRYNAIFQCDNADSIGPIRSARSATRRSSTWAGSTRCSRTSWPPASPTSTSATTRTPSPT